MFLDIAAGIMLPLWVAHRYGFFASPLFIACGIISALLPDIDILLTKIGTVKQLIGEHRSAVHYPAPYAFIACFVWLLCGRPVGLLFALGVFYHLVHDTFFLGWGIKWLWPFSQRSFSFFHDKGGKIAPTILVWSPVDDAKIRAEYQSPDWIRDFYLRPSLISLTEYPVFVLALVLLYRHFFM